MDIFQSRAKSQFLELFENFVDFLLVLWPDCQDSKDLKIGFNGIVKGNSTKEDETIDGWYWNMTISLSKRVKYFKAVERIIGQTPLLYHACAYNDIDAVELSSESKVLTDVDMFAKYRDGTMRDDDKKVFWKYLAELNDVCYKLKDEKPPYVPTREEIQKNIKQKKSNHTDNVDTSMSKAFQSTMATFCKQINQADITKNISEDAMSNVMSRWAAFAQDTVNSTKVSVLCNRKDVSVMSKLEDHFDEFKFKEELLITDDVWKSIVELNGFAAVGENIPGNMMSKIENIASKLADDIVNGKQTLDSVNLSEIGQQVLSDCNEEDMNKFANNVENLIPALQAFQKGSI